MTRKSSTFALSAVSLVALSTTLATVVAPAQAGAVGEQTRPAYIPDHALTGADFDAPDDGWVVGRVGGCCTGDAWARHWDGSRWHEMTLPNGTDDDRLQTVDARTPSDVWAVGYSVYNGENVRTLVEHWDGKSWSVIPSPDPVMYDDELYGVTAVGPDDVWAVGYAGNGAEQSLILHWDGQQWSIVDHPDPQGTALRIYSISSVSADDVWAVGSHSWRGRERATIEHWDGESWTVVPGAHNADSEELRAIWADDADDIWAVGGTSGQGVGAALTEHWDGTAWSRVDAPDNLVLTSVSGSASDDVWAAGFHYGESPSMLHWDGSSWSAVTVPAGKERLFAVSAASSHQAVVVGYVWSEADGIILGWDGSRWSRCRRACW